MLFIQCFFLTLIGYIISKKINQLFPQIPAIVYSMFIILALLAVSQISYVDYSQSIDPIFNRLLGYVTVGLAIPLATLKYDDIPLKKTVLLVIFASTTASALPVGMAYILELSKETILSFSTRSITTPIALNIADIVHAPPSLVTLIVILSGVIGALFSGVILRNIQDERAVGLALGLAAHAIGTAQAWQRSPIAGKYAAFGMALNGIITAVWLPILLYFI